jgi:cation:H+ antiporter
MGGTVLTFLFMFVGKRKILQRWQSAILLAIFLGYMVYLVQQG